MYLYTTRPHGKLFKNKNNKNKFKNAFRFQFQFRCKLTHPLALIIGNWCYINRNLFSQNRFILLQNYGQKKPGVYAGFGPEECFV